MSIEALAVRRFMACTKEDFRIQNGRQPTKPEIFGIVEASGMVLASGLPKSDNIVLKNGAGVIKSSQIEVIKKTIFERKKQLKHF